MYSYASASLPVPPPQVYITSTQSPPLHHSTTPPPLHFPPLHPVSETNQVARAGRHPYPLLVVVLLSPVQDRNKTALCAASLPGSILSYGITTTIYVRSTLRPVWFLVVPARPYYRSCKLYGRQPVVCRSVPVCASPACCIVLFLSLA